MPPAPLTPDSLPLRDIHLPAPVSWWPPAPGWWLLAVGVIVLIYSCFWLRQRSRRRRFKRLALSRLDQLEQQYRSPGDDLKLQQELSCLLRQAAILHYPKSNCAGLIGETWLKFLDQTLDGKSFSQGVGQLLESGPYRPRPADFDAPELLGLCRSWLQRLPPLPKTARGQR